MLEELLEAETLGVERVPFSDMIVKGRQRRWVRAIYVQTFGEPQEDEPLGFYAERTNEASERPEWMTNKALLPKKPPGR